MIKQRKKMIFCALIKIKTKSNIMQKILKNTVKHERTG
jgi:hypothetical protein